MERQQSRLTPGPLWRAFSGAGHAVLDAVLPPQCLNCTELVSTTGVLCQTCWERIDFISPPVCTACGYPFDFDTGPNAGEEAPLCGACARDLPAFARARAVMRYDPDSRGLILGFKHGDRLHGAKAFGHWLARAGADLLADADLIAPVPLHWRRRIARRFNQSALLTQAVSRDTGRPWCPDLLRRTRATASQGHLGRKDRARNVRGAFAVNPARGALLKDARIVLVDDVLTTGATAGACATALLKGGAAQVDVLVLARVARGAAFDQ